MTGDARRELVERSAAPAAVRTALDQLGPVDDDGLFAAVVAVTAASRSLTRFVLAHRDEALAVLASLDVPVVLDASSPHALAHSKQLEFLRIAARDLLGRDALEATGAALASLAAAVLEGAAALAGATGLAVIGMGKLGGAELNYASDVDVLFVGGDAGAARHLLEIARRCFRVDAGLRPEGRDGALTRTLDSYETYWDRWAQPWEFQALLKARPVAGDVELGRAFAAAASRRVWERPFSADDIRSLRAMKARSEGEVARRQLAEREVKRGRGGIRDIEFAVQLLQLVHGRHDPGLRSPTTLDALAELSGAGYVDPADAGALEDAYRFLRAVEHRLQLVDEAQVHTVPADARARAHLARVLGFRDEPDRSAVEQLDATLRRHQATVRSIHERLYFRPLLEAFAGSGRLSPAAAEARLAAFGFADAERTRQALRELTRGLTRSSRLMQQLLPLLLEWLSDTADPDLGLLGLRTLVSGSQQTQLVNTFRESPETARRLCQVVGTSRLLLRTIQHNPDLVALLGDDRSLVLPSRDDLVAEVAANAGWRRDAQARAAGLQRLKQRQELLVAARDIFGLDDVSATGAALAHLADALVDAALRALDPQVPIAVVAMGRFGGRELSYASDLDVLFVHAAGDAAGAAEAERVAAALLRFLTGTTPASRIYDVDADLRPEGRNGPLARSIDAYDAYYERWAQTWELQALVRARPVAGDPALGAAFTALVERHVWGRPFTDAMARDIRRMKARVERERIPPGEDPQFHLKLGRGGLADVEWTAQLLQLRHGIRATGTVEALEALAAAGALGADDARVLVEAYRYCERTRNRWFLVKGSRGDSLPTAAEALARLARSLDTTGPALREEYRRRTRRARAVVERLFYGRDERPGA